MLESAQDIVKEKGKEAANAAAERFKGVLPAYILTSWLAYNWSNIALLFMSTASVEQRIQEIYGLTDLYLNFLVYPVATGIVLAMATPFFEFLISKSNSYFKVRVVKADTIAAAKFDDKIKIITENTLKTDGRIAELMIHRDNLIRENNALTNKSDDLLRAINVSYDKILSNVLRANFIQEELAKFRLEGPKSEDELKEFFDATFPDSERGEALKRRAILEANFGPTAIQNLLDGEPKPLTADPDLVRELLVLTGVIDGVKIATLAGDITITSGSPQPIQPQSIQFRAR